MKNPHAKYTYEYKLLSRTGQGVEEIPGCLPTHVAIYRRQIKSDAGGYQHTQWLLDIPVSEVQVSAPEKQPPATSAELCERLRQLSAEIDTLSEAMRQLAGNNKRLHLYGSRQLWSFAAMPKIWAEKIEVLEQK